MTNKYRTHNCSELRKEHIGSDVVLSGWINKKRDHGNLLFIDLRDNFGITQCVIDKSNEIFKKIEKLSLETVIKITGVVIERSNETINKNISTGEIEVKINNIDITVVLQSPSLQSYNQDIRNNLCSLCNINLDQISLKATTTDKLGFLGRKEGVAAFATTLLINNESKN